MQVILAEVKVNWWMILIFSAFLGVFWAYFLSTHKRGNVPANRFAAILLIALATLIIRHSAPIDGDGSVSSFFYFLSQGVIFIIGPSILFHFESLAGKHLTAKRVLAHYSPATLFTAALAVVFNYREELKNINDTTPLKIILFSFITLQIGHLLLYLLVSRKEINRYEARFGQYHTASSRINLRWMKGLIRIISIFSILVLTMYFLILSGGYYEMNNNADLLFLLAVGLIILRIVVTSWRQPEISSGIYQEEQKYKNSRLSEDETANLKTKLDQYIRNTLIFKNTELNLPQLANELETPTYILSQLINQAYEKNFFHFINDLRIEYAAKKIDGGALKTLTLAGIAHESGFNSMSTFNRAFKKKMGCTPKEFSKTKKPG